MSISVIELNESQMQQVLQTLECLGPIQPYSAQITTLSKRGIAELDVPFTKLEVTTCPDSITVRYLGRAINTEPNIRSQLLCSSIVYDPPLDFFKQLGYNVTMETSKTGKKTTLNGIQVVVYNSNNVGVLEFSTTCTQKLLANVYETIKELRQRFKPAIQENT